MFFSQFPRMEYAFIDESKESKTSTNILSAFFLRRISTKNANYQLYILDDTDTVESISEELYKSPFYYWVLLLVNNIVNPYLDWTQNSNTIQSFTAKKYENGVIQNLVDGTQRVIGSSSGLEGLHHFYNDTTGDICDDYDDVIYRAQWIEDATQIPVNIIPVTNLEYEIEVNNSKRNISIVPIGDLMNFVTNFSTMLASFPKG